MEHCCVEEPAQVISLRIHTVHGNEGTEMRIAMVWLRQYVPKGSDLSVVTAEALSAVEKRLNFRPQNAWDLNSHRWFLTNY